MANNGPQLVWGVPNPQPVQQAPAHGKADLLGKRAIQQRHTTEDKKDERCDENLEELYFYNNLWLNQMQAHFDAHDQQPAQVGLPVAPPQPPDVAPALNELQLQAVQALLFITKNSDLYEQIQQSLQNVDLPPVNQLTPIQQQAVHFAHFINQHSVLFINVQNLINPDPYANLQIDPLNDLPQG